MMPNRHDSYQKTPIMYLCITCTSLPLSEMYHDNITMSLTQE